MYTHPGDGFSILMQTAIIVGIVLALPVILYQVYTFLSPALYRHEKRIAIPVILGTVRQGRASENVARFVFGESSRSTAIYVCLSIESVLVNAWRH